MTWQEFLEVIVIIAATTTGFGSSDDPECSDEVTTNDYSHIHRDTLSYCHLIKDVAMLGAHDAFTTRIDNSSDFDPNSGDARFNEWYAKLIAGGLFRRLAKAQRSEGYDLCRRGVRYFDTRPSWNDGKGAWWTTHSFYSRPYADELKELLRFLDENPGEFLIVDHQFIYTGSGHTQQECVETIANIRSDGSGRNLWDFVRFNPDEISISELTYGDVTVGGTQAGAVVLTPLHQPTGFKTYYRRSGTNTDPESVISVSSWQETDDYDTLLAGIRKSVASITDADRQKLRINQCQMSPPSSMGVDNVYRMTDYWSLLHQGEESNAKIIDLPDIASWFASMPILITDNVDSMVNDWNDRIIPIINAYNRASTPFCFDRVMSSFSAKRLG
jgi:hypothetical protein